MPDFEPWRTDFDGDRWEGGRSGAMNAGNIRLFATDLDGTLFGRPESTDRFTAAWASLSPGRRPLLVYNTGRTVSDTRGLVRARRLPAPDYIIGGIGTELQGELDDVEGEFRARFGGAWDVARVEAVVASLPGVRRQPAEFLHPLKSSWFWMRARRDEIEALERRLREAGIQAHIDYSCRYFLDIVPIQAGKGRALAWLCRRLGVPLEQVLVAGDTGNDTSMFLLPEVKGIVVENALPELLAAIVQRSPFVARTSMADGVVEGLRYFGVLAALPAGSASL